MNSSLEQFNPPNLQKDDQKNEIISDERQVENQEAVISATEERIQIQDQGGIERDPTKEVDMGKVMEEYADLRLESVRYQIEQNRVNEELSATIDAMLANPNDENAKAQFHELISRSNNNPVEFSKEPHSDVVDRLIGAKGGMINLQAAEEFADLKIAKFIRENPDATKWIKAEDRAFDVHQEIKFEKTAEILKKIEELDQKRLEIREEMENLLTKSAELKGKSISIDEERKKLLEEAGELFKQPSGNIENLQLLKTNTENIKKNIEARKNLQKEYKELNEKYETNANNLIDELEKVSAEITSLITQLKKMV